MTGIANPLHIGMLLVVLLLVFGAKRLPEMGKSMGEGLRGFKGALGGDHDDAPALAQATRTPETEATPERTAVRPGA